MLATKKRTRNTGYVIAGLRAIVKDKTATIRQRLDALDRLAIIYKAYEIDLKPTRTIKISPEEIVPVEVVAPDDEGEQLLKQFNERHYNGGDNARSDH
jgi:hypothetical protein